LIFKTLCKVEKFNEVSLLSAQNLKPPQSHHQPRQPKGGEQAQRHRDLERQPPDLKNRAQISKRASKQSDHSHAG
jgi:hypothetical protein